jgi:hypothetical protein
MKGIGYGLDKAFPHDLRFALPSIGFRPAMAGKLHER